MADKWWRVSHLYKVKNEDGDVVPFVPFPTQATLANDLHDRNIVLKSRQHGVTTLFNVWFVDECIFNSGTRCAFIAQGLAEAKEKLAVMREVLMNFIKDNPEFRELLMPLKADSKQDLELANGSKIYVSTTVRSDTVQLLHISEFGKISYYNPEKGREVLDGSLNAVHKNSLVIIESTAMGSHTQFKDMCDAAFEATTRAFAGKSKLTRLNFKWHFFSWWMDAKNQLSAEESEYVEIPEWQARYYSELSARGVNLQPQQKAWYYVKKLEGTNVLKEHPSTPEECWQEDIKGAFFARELNDLRSRGRITKVPFNPNRDVHTAWDLGISDYTCIWFFQVHGGEVHIIDYYENNDVGMTFYLQHVMAEWAKKPKEGGKGYRYGMHFGPHDIAKRDMFGGESLIDQLCDAGWNFVAAPKQDKYASIEQSRKLLSICFFDESRCQMGISRLENYRKKISQETGEYTSVPVHDLNSHGADAFRTLAARIDEVLLVRGRRRGKKSPRKPIATTPLVSQYVIG